jgi:hypothetical protein
MLRELLIPTILLVGGLGAIGRTDKPGLSKNPLTPEQNEIYGVFLDSYLSTNRYPGSEKNLTNLSNRTFPLEISELDNRDACLKDIELTDLADARQTVHLISVDISKDRPVKLVDRNKHKVDDPGKDINKGDSVEHAVTQGFKSGVLSMSEITFDKAHRFAVFKYGFYCGSRCGRGGTVVFEKEGDKWKPSKRSCSLWIS